MVVPLEIAGFEIAGLPGEKCEAPSDPALPRTSVPNVLSNSRSNLSPISVPRLECHSLFHAIPNLERATVKLGGREGAALVSLQGMPEHFVEHAVTQRLAQ